MRKFGIIKLTFQEDEAFITPVCMPSNYNFLLWLKVSGHAKISQ